MTEPRGFTPEQRLAIAFAQNLLDFGVAKLSEIDPVFRDAIERGRREHGPGTKACTEMELLELERLKKRLGAEPKKPGTLPEPRLLRFGPARVDVRGSFGTLFETDMLPRHDPPTQICLSSSLKVGTFRGLHWQAGPHVQAKAIACVRGRVLDVVADVDRASASFGKTWAFRLAAGFGDAVWVPPGLAHGWQALEDGAEILYAIWGPWEPAAERGARFDDPSLRLELHMPVTVASDRDRSWPAL